MKNARSVFAVIVSYRPDLDRLEQVLRALDAQVFRIVIVDNGNQRETLERLSRTVCTTPCEVLAQQGNVGLARAQNEGIRWAMRAGAEYILLLDDDSIPAWDMVAKLVVAIEAVTNAGRRIAAAGPVFEDDRSSVSSYFVQIGALGLRRVRCTEPELNMMTDLLISSGSLIPAAVLRELGLMDETLFIDHVDTEWCLRALSHGYRLLGVCGARMSHRLGAKPLRVTADRRFFVHSPIRYYYICRNSVLLYRRSYPSLRWKVVDALRLLSLLGGIIVYADARLERLKAAGRGLVDGMRGRAGPAPEDLARLA